MSIKMVLSMIIAVFFVLPGCGFSLMKRDTLMPLSEEVRLQSRRIVVAPSSTVPDTSFDPSSLKGEHKGFAGGFFYGAFKGVEAVSTGRPIGVLFLPLTVPVGAVAGAVGGAINAVPYETVQKIDGLLKDVATNANIQTMFSDRFIAVASADLKQPIERIESGKTDNSDKRNDHSNDIIVEVEISDFGLLGGEGADPETSFIAVANVKTSVPDGNFPVSGAVTCPGTRQSVSAWTKDGDAQIRKELGAAYECLSQKIVTTLFHEHRLANSSAESDDDTHGKLRQFYPRPVANSLRPLLQWEAFPRATDLKEDKGGYLTRINDVTYDIKIYGRKEDRSNDWKAKTYQLLTVIYQKEAIRASELIAEAPVSQAAEDPFHPPAKPLDKRAPLKHAGPGKSAGTVRIAEYVLDSVLLPQETYLWTVRARFRINGQERITSWSGFQRMVTPEFPLPREVGGDPAGPYGGRSPSLAALSIASVKYSEKAQVQDKTFHTAVNLWFDKTGKITTTNYHDGTLLPLGTKVVINKVYDNFSAGHEIRFIDNHTKNYTIELTRHVEKDTTIWDVLEKYFIEQDPKRAGGFLGTLKTEEAANVDSGMIKVGMTKAEVLMAYGYPPSHRTPDLEANKWTYWASEDIKKTVYFVNDIVQHVQTEWSVHAKATK